MKVGRYVGMGRLDGGRGAIAVPHSCSRPCCAINKSVICYKRCWLAERQAPIASQSTGLYTFAFGKKLFVFGWQLGVCMFDNLAKKCLFNLM